MAVGEIETAPTPAAIPSSTAERPAADIIEMTLPDGSRVRIGSDVNLAAAASRNDDACPDDRA
jgi:hypothetical protein